MKTGVEEDATMLVAQHDDQVISFIVDSGAQSHNLQDTEAFGLERSKTSATGYIYYIASQPTGAIGSPRVLIDGGGKRHNAGQSARRSVGWQKISSQRVGT